MNSRNRPTLKSYKIRVGITMGDPSGIGAGIILKALEQVSHLADFVIFGSRWVMEELKYFNPGILSGVDFIDISNISKKKFKFGLIKAEYGMASIEYLDRALEYIGKKKIDCLVTSPISKEAINLAGFKFSGHTEYFQKNTRAGNIVMMLLNKNLRFSLLTRHIPLKDVSKKINKKILYDTISLTHQALKKLFLIRKPHIVICGLNPHASDNGVIGSEENRIIKPALGKLKKITRYIDGPLSADIAIKKAKEKKYDCVIAMYHDQALIPLKLLGDSTGVNMTLGLPFLRTSPLHGTAFDIAGTNLINPGSLVEAIKLAVSCILNQRSRG